MDDTWKNDPPTEKQMLIIRSLGFTRQGRRFEIFLDDNETKGAIAEKIGSHLASKGTESKLLYVMTKE